MQQAAEAVHKFQADAVQEVHNHLALAAVVTISALKPGQAANKDLLARA